jgi:nitroimidazol reductase NimA-like FMN-containing flavoprotein (pyridoxamine 5'-phosphate oxidase superfamily)
MTDSLKQDIIDYLKDNMYANLATVNAVDAAQPHVSTIAYVNDGLNLFFVTNRNSRKFANLTGNSRVALTIDKEEPDWMKITGLQIWRCDTFFTGHKVYPPV